MYGLNKRKAITRILKAFLWLCAAFFVFSIVLVVVFRWAPVPVSGLMIHRELVANFSDKALPEREFQWTHWSAISGKAPLAVIAAEDQRFFAHHGFDFAQLEKAIAESREGKRLRGASTISQQTAKNLFLWGSRSYLRKALEAWFTLLIEFIWPKQRILEVYLNIIEFGPGIYGVGAASQKFFNKPPQHLDHNESALLAAVLPNPHRMHVARPSQYVRERQRWIATQMHQLGSVKILQSMN